jgi:hypothetical protein
MVPADDFVVNSSFFSLALSSVISESNVSLTCLRKALSALFKLDLDVITRSIMVSSGMIWISLKSSVDRHRVTGQRGQD